MNRIRIKIVLSLFVITLLPVFPVYYLVKNLLQTSREVGFNENVELALEQAVDISRELYSKYKNETLAFAQKVASMQRVKSYVKQSSAAPNMTEHLDSIGKARIEFFDKTGKLVYTQNNDPRHTFPVLYQNTLVPLTKKLEPEVLTRPDDPGHISAFAPIVANGTSHGFVVITKVVEADFIAGRKQIVEVNQMFKTLEFFDLTRGFVLSFFAVYAPIAVLSVGLGYYFSRKITRPLLTLVNGTQKVAKGEWDHRVQVSSKDEVGELMVAFNNMVSTLKKQQDQVVALEKMAIWREIARILAHEIKNPLTPIQLTVQQMQDKYPGDDPEYQKLLAECTEIVGDEIESLRTLVREFSEFARMPKLNLAPGDLNELVEEVARLYKDRPLVLALDSSVSEFDFDYEKLRRVLINLIENSLDSMQEQSDGHVYVKTNRKSETVILEVADSGTGIPADLREKIFEPYFSTKKSGVGLGLAIVKRIVEEHGGRLSLESQEMKGTTFRIELPI